jgi:hypothetical protein
VAKKPNKQIRAARGKIAMWVIAEFLGMTEKALRNLLRSELPENKKVAILNAIQEVKKNYQSFNEDE